MDQLQFSFRDDLEMAIDPNTLKLLTFLSSFIQGPPQTKSDHSSSCLLGIGAASPGHWQLTSGVSAKAHSQARTRE